MVEEDKDIGPESQNREVMEPGGLYVELKYWSPLGRLRQEEAESQYMCTLPNKS